MKSATRQHIIDICEGFIEGCPYLIPEGLEITFNLEEEDYRNILKELHREYLTDISSYTNYTKLGHYFIEHLGLYSIKYVNKGYKSSNSIQEYLPKFEDSRWYQSVTSDITARPICPVVKDNRLSNLSLSDLNVIRSLLSSQTFDSDLTREQRDDLQEKIVLELQNRLKKLI